jgi:hypothetical protein
MWQSRTDPIAILAGCYAQTWVESMSEFKFGAAQLIFGVGAPVDFNPLVFVNDEQRQCSEAFHGTVTTGCPGMLQMEPTGQAESTEAIVAANSRASSSESVPLGIT